MRFVTRVVAWCLVASCALLATSVPAVARPAITGKLTQPGYTVIALAAGGRATSVVARHGRFRLTPRAGTVTLHLRRVDGVYAGPVVIRGAGRRAIVGVKAGARLGRIAVRRGYARVARRLPARWVGATRTARARHGVPIGARVFGRVRTKLARGSPPGDLDRDGIPDPLDIDDDGDLVLDNVDRSRTARAAQAQGSYLAIHSFMYLPLDKTVNANTGTTAAADAAVSSSGALKLHFVLGDSVELDCGRPQSRTDPTLGGLVYCTKGGTGRIQQPEGAPSDLRPFPDCCDADGDGFGTLAPRADVSSVMILQHGARTDQIGTGDELIEWVGTSVPESQCPSASASCIAYTATVQYVFATVPALVSYDDGRGPVRVDYPAGNAGSLLKGSGPDGEGDVVVKLTFWRPQRLRIAADPVPQPGESDTWTDIGRLDYGVGLGDGACPQSAFLDHSSSLTAPVSSPGSFGPSGGFLTDAADDSPANPANTFTYALNLTQCLASNGLSFNPGETRTFSFGGATSGGDSAFQAVSFTRA